MEQQRMSALAPKDPLGLMTIEEKFKAATALADWWKVRYEAAQRELDELVKHHNAHCPCGEIR